MQAAARVRPRRARKLSELLHRPVNIAQVRLNPYALSATIRGLRIGDRDGGKDLFALKEVYVNLQLASVWKGGVVIQQVRVVEPAVHVVRTAEHRYNFSDIVDELAAGPPSAPPPPTPDAKPARFSVSNIELVGGHVTLDDRWKATRHEIAGINLGIPFLSNFPYLVETFVQPAFAAVINGTRLAIDGRTKPFADSLESSVDINLTKVDLPYYWAYVPVKLRLKLLSAVLDTKLKVTFIQYRDRPSRVDVAGGIALSALEVEDDAGRPLLELPLLDIDIASSDLLSNRLSVRRVLLQSLAAHVRRDGQGELQFASLVVADPAPQPTKGVAAKQPAKPPSKDDTKSTPWLVEVGELKLDGARIAFADAANPRPFATTLDPLNIGVTGFSTARGKQAKLALATTTDAGERLSVEGRLSVDPFSFDGTVALQGLSLPRFAPYYASQILFEVRQGTLELSVPVHVAIKGKELELVITGLRTELRDLQVRRRGDRDDFFRLPVLAIADTNFDLGRSQLVLGEGERATVNLGGKLGNGPLEISGRINPLAKQPFVDIVFKLADVDLSAMTPYSGKYAGYAVEKGQLYLDLKYLIEARKLDAQNNVRISQFTFGNAVDSKDATKLPVRLAVSLLKDRHGVIQLDVPVSGSLDDPKFSVWAVALTVVKNLLVKAATSPFALIGSLFGGGEELAFVEFEPGLADVPVTSRGKLETLARALYERPALRLEIEGHAALTQDLEALRRLELRRKVTAEKVKEIVAAGGDAKTDATVTDAEYPKYLKLAYRADDKAAKPKNALGMLKDVPDAEMERLLLSTIAINQDDLRLLARRRAQVAREHILRAKAIPTERIFVIEPKSIAPERKDKVRDSRVDFRLM